MAYLRSLLWGGGHGGRSKFFIKGEQVFHALAVVLERLRAIAQFHRAVEVGMGFDERGRHR